jgi:hypothetical protein
LAAPGLASSALPGSAAGSASGAAANDVVSNPSVLDITSSSTEVAYISPAALLTPQSGIENSIRHEQCYFKTPDPMFFVPDEGRKVNWTLAGKLDADRHFHTDEYRSLLTLGLVPGSEQVNSWPVELVSLADMPQVFLDQRLPILAQAKLPDLDAHQLAQQYVEQAQRIQQIVQHLEVSFDPSWRCGDQPRPAPRNVAMQAPTAR